MKRNSSKSSKACFNSNCSNIMPERPRKGWRLNSGQLADLCDRCAHVYEDGFFCESFHAGTSGWRCCTCCGKSVHCGCIVSADKFNLLDRGGIVCRRCYEKNRVVDPRQAKPSSSYIHAPLPGRMKDLPVKKWSQFAGSGCYPWQQAPNLFNSSTPPSNFHRKGSYVAEISLGIERMNLGERSSTLMSKKKKIVDFTVKGSPKLGAQKSHRNGNGGISSMGCSSRCLNKFQPASSTKESHSRTLYGLFAPYSSTSRTNGYAGAFASHLRSIPPPLPMKQFHGKLHNGVQSSGESQIPDNGPRLGWGRTQLAPCYWPKLTDQQLPRMSRNSNSVLTPLFEKMLSASDAGRIGRLVLPKKCAEAYFPPISHPEGLPLRVQDITGKVWTFQFRFWPNNNSRMYVLEGITPCIQSMQLHAGDTVTFSRLEPEGKLVLGYRRAPAAPPSDQADLAEPNSWFKVDKPGYITKETIDGEASRKRKNNTVGPKSKCPRMESEDFIELKLTLKEAQGLLRPPPNYVPNIVAIEGSEFEEYEDAPILGKPTIFSADNSGKKVQWVQCKSCLKWRKLPGRSLLPSYWICSDNSWDSERASCSAAQELTEEQLEDLLYDNDMGGLKKPKSAKQHAENTKSLEGLDTLANLAIMGEGEALPTSVQATTKHPRHRPGCSCIVCIQPPSGKGPKHKQSCTCIVCQSVKRRFRTIMLQREKKQSEKEAETTCTKQKQHQQTEKTGEDDHSLHNNCGNTSPNQHINLACDIRDHDSIAKSSKSSFKGQIDLNIQPEKEEEPSQVTGSLNVIRMSQGATELRLKQQRLISAANDRTLAINHIDSDKNSSGEEPSDNVSHGSSHQDVEDRDGSHPQKNQLTSQLPGSC